MVFVLKVNDLLPDICQWFKHLMPIRQSIILPTILNWVLNTIMLYALCSMLAPPIGKFLKQYKFCERVCIVRTCLDMNSRISCNVFHRKNAVIAKR